MAVIYVVVIVQNEGLRRRHIDESYKFTYQSITLLLFQIRSLIGSFLHMKEMSDIIIILDNQSRMEITFTFSSLERHQANKEFIDCDLQMSDR